MIPGYVGLATLAATVLTLYLLYRDAGLGVMVGLSPVVGLVYGFAAAVFVAALKKCVMGTYRPEIKPLWCRYVWLNEMVNGAYESIFAPVVSTLLGTPFIAPFLRMIGCRVGRHTYIGTTLFSEFDLVEIGDCRRAEPRCGRAEPPVRGPRLKSSTLRIERQGLPSAT